MSTLVDHWRRLIGSVHPDDAPFLSSRPHSFNLDWPPPAYIGDVDNAPVVLLMMNGGYNPEMTPREFADAGAIERYLDMLHNPRPVKPNDVSPYYDTANYGGYIANGRMVLVNALAYRSGKLSEERQNRMLADILPSTLVHRTWLKETVIPQAIAGDRVVIAHRNGLWDLDRYQFDHPNIIFSQERRAGRVSSGSPNFARLSPEVIRIISGDY
ncbi:hypothetical protein [Paracoccus sp. 228]|uniref:hypothetical protein n=1 Tax=Paracoccus sp. 228 TaxID=1192054 RepID=UPI0005DF4883|nr:hypothetical protein [Paracoccus sp. 228]KIX16277.1 hypothetical protein SY26_18785 [Paracoccus sp. 228]